MNQEHETNNQQKNDNDSVGWQQKSAKTTKINAQQKKQLEKAVKDKIINYYEQELDKPNMSRTADRLTPKIIFALNKSGLNLENIDEITEEKWKELIKETISENVATGKFGKERGNPIMRS